MVISRDKLWDSGHDETVEVNQRALIDKILSRYSGEFTVFRELLQNSDDAQSGAVEIKFETQAFLDSKLRTNNLKPGTSDSISTDAAASLTSNIKNDGDGLPDLRTAHVHQWTFRNNGIIFRDEDWNRLKKIAEGNPDEEKIGAFGVGFYSLFSVTDEPLVTSGDQWMGFYWKDKKDQLFARRGRFEDADVDYKSDAWTTFAMSLRDPTPIPTAFDFTRFLASSLTFMRHLNQVCVYFDDKRLVKLNKASGMPRELGIPKGLKNQSPTGIMTVEGIRSTPLFIQAQVMKWIYTSGSQKKRATAIKQNKPSTSGSGFFFSSLFSSFSGGSTPRAATPQPPPPIQVDHLAVNETSVSLLIYSASVLVKLNQKLSTEIHRSTKKNPPTNMKFELIYTAKDEYDASLEEEAKQPEATGSIFQGLRADLDGVGAARVFIGHSTAQSTGLGGHIAGRFIPTVERESIDFMDRNVAVWNKELLYIGGFLARATYESELSTVQKQWEASGSSLHPPDAEIRKQLTGRVLHALKFFMFYTSTPSSEVSTLMEASFFACSSDGHFRIISNKGVRDAATVHLPDPTFSGFIKDLPTLPEDIMTLAPMMISSLQARGLIKPINFQDVLKELQSRPLDKDEFVLCLRWWINVFRDGEQGLLLPIRTQVINALVLMMQQPDGDSQKVIPLTSIKSFINPRSPSVYIPIDGPLPESLLPIAISKLFKPEDLAHCFPWTELSIGEWAAFICDADGFASEFNINLSPSWSERVIGVLSRTWPNLIVHMKSSVIQHFQTKTCIPTTGGMKLPHEAYFPNVNIFSDLPVVLFASGLPIKGYVEKILQEMGVRKHVDLQVIFNRMVKTNEWTIPVLTRYLVSVKSSLTPEEMERLELTSAFPSESPTVEIESGKRTRYRANQLYEPLDVFRHMKLLVIDWGHQTKWRSSSEEAKFLFDLGLQRFPPLDILIKLCAESDSNIRSVAFKYLIDNLSSRYADYDPMNFKDIRFLPALKEASACLGTIQEIFAAPWASVGFLVLQPAYEHYASKLKIKQHPPTSQLMAILQNKPPRSENGAKELFRLLAGRVNDFSNSNLQTLSTTAFVPIFVPIKSEKNATESIVRWLPPSQCYLVGESRETFHSKLFVFVDFGPAANAFLAACGTRNQPSVEEVVKILLANPRHFYELAEGPNNFLSEIRNIAVNSHSISAGTMSRMKKSPILLCQQRKARRQEETSDDWDEDHWDTVYDIKIPSEIIVVDDTHAYQTFGSELYTAPQEDIVEDFYTRLGSPLLSKVIMESYQTTLELRNSKQALETRALILERLPLFLHEHTHAETRFKFSWMSTAENFLVKSFGKLTVVKTLKHGTLNISRKQDVSAVAKHTGPIQLWLAANSQIDMYEVATSLNRLLFHSPKANDALLFMTILSTDLRALKRRGYNVDRILKRQKDSNLAEDKARETMVQNTSLLPFANTVTSPIPNPKAHIQQSKPKPQDDDQIRPVTHGSLGNSTLNDESEEVIGAPRTSANRPVETSSFLNHINSIVNPNKRVSTTTPDPVQGVTPKDDITKNIEMAINSCRSESTNILQNREHMQRIRESLNDGYCDISGRKEDLHNIGQMGTVKVYLSQELMYLSETFLKMKEESGSLSRFISVITPLAKIYQLPLTKFHIFYDLQGGIIAFNRSGSIFLNLRYFEEWHDADVNDNKWDTSYISWYFTIAHEVAHNLVQPHNSEHEFYFSAICERFIVKLAKLLS